MGSFKPTRVLMISALTLAVFTTFGLLVYFITSRSATLSGHPQPGNQKAQLLPKPSEEAGLATSVPMVELPPLYPKVQWEASTSANLQINIELASGETTEKYVEATYRQSILLSSNPFALNNDFWTYYVNELKERGWREYPIADSSGPQGLQQFWVNNGHYFSIGYKQVYQGSPRTDIYGTPQNLEGYRLFIEYD